MYSQKERRRLSYPRRPGWSGYEIGSPASAPSALIVEDSTCLSVSLVRYAASGQREGRKPWGEQTIIVPAMVCFLSERKKSYLEGLAG